MKLVSSETSEPDRKGRTSTRLSFEVAVVRAASDLGDTGKTVDRVASNEEASATE